MNATKYHVRLRNVLRAVVYRAPSDASIDPFHLLGMDADGNYQSWRLDGRWREHGLPHLLDIVTVPTITPPEMDSGTFDSNPIG